MQTKKIVSKFLIALALTFMIPQLVLLYAWEDFPARVSPWLVLFTLCLIGAGLYLMWDIIQSVRLVIRNLQEMTKGERGERLSGQGDELQMMGNSIEILSKKIVEDMEALQHSAENLEKTKAELNEALLYSDNIMNSMGDALIVVDPTLKIKQVNQTVKDLLNYREEALIGRSIHALCESSAKEDFSKVRFVAGKRLMLVTSEGARIPADVNIRPLVDANGVHLGYVVVARDMRRQLAVISRLKGMNRSLEAEIQEKTKAIEKVYKSLKRKDAYLLQQEKMASVGIMATGVAHEINNPLGYIRSNLEMLQGDIDNILSYTHLLEYGLSTLAKEEDRDKRTKEADQIMEVRAKMQIERHFTDAANILKESREGLDRIKQIVDDLKRFSRNDTDHPEKADMNQELQRTLSVVGHELKYKAKIVTAFGSLPLLSCHPCQLNQVFANLLVNAAQAIEGRGRVSIRTFSQEGSIYIVIEDSGPGIPPENLKKVFDPFFTTKPVGKGTGLGLYLSRKIVESHGGTLTVESKPGKGAAFTVRLPLSGVVRAPQADSTETLPATV